MNLFSNNTITSAPTVLLLNNSMINLGNVRHITYINGINHVHFNRENMEVKCKNDTSIFEQLKSPIKNSSDTIQIDCDVTSSSTMA